MAAITVSPFPIAASAGLPHSEDPTLLSLPREILSAIGEYAATGEKAAWNGVVFGRVCSLTHSIAQESRQMEAVRHRKILELCQVMVVKLAVESEDSNPTAARMCYGAFKKSLTAGEDLSLRAREALHQLRTCFAVAAAADPRWTALSIARCTAPLREFSTHIVQDMVAGFVARPLMQITYDHFYAATAAIENYFSQERTLSQEPLLDKRQIEAIVRTAILDEHGDEEFEKVVKCCRLLAQSTSPAIKAAALQSARFYGSFPALRPDRR